MDPSVDKKNNIFTIIQARFNSTMLLGKTLLQLGGIPVLSNGINRAKIFKLDLR